MTIGLPMPFVVDYSAARPGAAAIKAAGGIGVVRYCSPGRTDGTNIDAAEIADFAAHGLPYALVIEFEATWLLRGYQSGHDLAVAGRQLEQSLSIPPGVTFAACDFDAGPSQFPTILETLHGMADGYGGWQYVGAYGSSQFCDWVAANCPITRFWSTDAWSGGYVSPHSALHQRATWAAGVPVVQGADYNDVLGDWGPRTTEDDMTPAQEAKLNECVAAILQLGAAINTLEANEATRSQLITKGDATHYGLLQIKADMAAIEKAVNAAPPGTADPGLMAAVTAVGAKIDGLKLGVVA